VAFGGENPATCELASKTIVSRSSSGLAQLSNLGDIQIRALRRNLAERAIDGVFSDRGFSIDSAV